LVSVVLPIYNHERYVVEAIKSVFDQTYRPIELIAIDDGSTDDSFARAAAFVDAAAGASGISVSLTRQENRDSSETINACLAKARGRYIAILNSDDAYAPDRIEKCVRVAETGGKPFIVTYVEAIGSDGQRLSADHPWSRWYRTAVMHELGIHPTLSVAILYANLAVSSGNFFFAREVLDRVGAFGRFRYGTDLDYLFRVSRLVEPYLLREKLYRYRIHDANTITANVVSRDREVSEIICEHLRALNAHPAANPLSDVFRTWPAHFNTFPWPAPVKQAFDRMTDPEVAAAPKPAGPASHLPAPKNASTGLSIVTHELSRTGAPVLVLEIARAFRGEGSDVRVFSPSDGPLRGDFARGGVPVILWDQKVTAHPQVDVGPSPAPPPATPVAVAAAAVRPKAKKKRKRKKHRAPWKWFLRGKERPKKSPPPAAVPAAAAPGAVAVSPANPGPAKVDASARRPTEPLLINSAVNVRVARWAAGHWQGPAFWYIHETVAPEIVVPAPDLVPMLKADVEGGRLKMLFGSDATRRAWAASGFDGDVAYWSGLPAVAEDAAVERLHAPPKRRTILNVGSNVGRKGTPALIEAFAHGRSRGHIPEDVDLCIVGLFPPSQIALSRDIIRRVGELGLSANVRLVGIVEPHVLDAYFDEADVYVQASIMECLPIALLTAMSKGLPIVTTNVDGCIEAIVDGECGLTVEPRDIEEMSRAIGVLLADPARARQFGDAARRRFNAHFSLEATLPRLAGILFPERTAPEA
jgi:glycosyltransferase involved in cell wall biosynthesis